MKKEILSAVFFLISTGLWANGDPTDRVSALSRSANPTPRTLTDIHIISEELRIKPGIHTTIFVRYVLWNASEKDYKDIDYGFPVDYGGVGEKYINSPLQSDYYSDSRDAMGWHDDYIRNITFLADGKTLPFEISPEIVLERPPIEQYTSSINEEFDLEEAQFYTDMMSIGRKWFYTQFSISAGDLLTLEVHYTLRNALSKSTFGRFFPTHGESSMVSSFYYDLAPAAHWGDGNVRDFSVEIDISDINITKWAQEVPDRHPVSYGIYGLPFEHEENKLIYTTRNFNFKDADPLYMIYQPEITPDEWLPHRIGNEHYAVMASDYKSGYPASNLTDLNLETAWAVTVKEKPGKTKSYVNDTITIKLHKPTAIAAIMILGGYHKNKEIFMRNHRPKQIEIILYGFKEKHVSGTGWINEPEESPVSFERVYYNEDYKNWEYKAVSIDDLPKHAMILEIPSYDIKKITKIDFIIREFYTGTHYDDVCISEILLLDYGIHKYSLGVIEENDIDN